MDSNNTNAIKDLDTISSEMRDKYFAGTIDILKFTTTFSLGFFAYLFIAYSNRDPGLNPDAGTITITGIFISISTIIGLVMVYNILSFWNYSWRIRSFHKNVLTRIIHQTNPNDETKVLNAQNFLKHKEQSLAIQIPFFLFTHIFGILISLAFYIEMTITKNQWLIGITLACGIIALIYLNIVNKIQVPTQEAIY